MFASQTLDKRGKNTQTQKYMILIPKIQKNKVKYLFWNTFLNFFCEREKYLNVFDALCIFISLL